MPSSPHPTGRYRNKSSRTGSADPSARRLLALLHTGADARRRKIRRIRSAIKAGTYENTLKLEVAIEKFWNSEIRHHGVEC